MRWKERSHGPLREDGIEVVKKSVYLESTIPSYLTARPSRDLIRAAHQHLTREWWETRRGEYETYVSQLVADEAANGDPEAAADRLRMLSGMPRLEINEAAVGLAKQLLDRRARAAERCRRCASRRGGVGPRNGYSVHPEFL